MFTEHKIGAFAAKVGDLADVPRMAPAALKAQFDAAPEELRASLNGVCDDGAALGAKVEGIIAQTFAGAIHESMLDAPLGAKLNAKAEKNALTAEETARKSADAALQTRVAAVETQKCTLVCGFYIGDDTKSRFINLGFTPKALLLLPQDGVHGDEDYHAPVYGGLALPGHPFGAPSSGSIIIAAEICDQGFRVYADNYTYTRVNKGALPYFYLAFQ